MKKICENPKIEPLKKENETIRQKLLRMIKDFEVYCNERHEKKMPIF